MDCRRALAGIHTSGGSKFDVVNYTSQGRADGESSSPGQDIVRSVAGPMACSLETIETYMEALPDARPWEVDQHVAPVPWRNSLASPGAKRLKIGFVIDDGVVKVQPPIARAMRETIEALKQAGHEGTYTLTILQLNA